MLVSEPVDCVPLVASAPDHPPVPVHAVAPVAFQLTIELAPPATVLGLALRVTAGAGATVTVVLACPVPPGPVQLSE